MTIARSHESIFLQWLKGPQQWGIYHVGNLAADRSKKARKDAMATVIWKAYEAGLVNLVQKKIKDETLYIVQKRKKRIRR